jgi:hypothetical protein
MVEVSAFGSAFLLPDEIRAFADTTLPLVLVGSFLMLSFMGVGHHAISELLAG